MSENCRNSYLKLLNVNVIQMVAQFVQFLLYFELLYRNKGKGTRRHLVP